MSLAMTWGDPGVRGQQPGASAQVAAHLTHEEFCHAVRRVAVARIQEEVTANLLLGAKLVYGVGAGNYRGVCIFNTWHARGQSTAVVEIAATGEESAVQLAGTTIHEVGHVLAGQSAGHGAEWKEACYRLGLGGPDRGGRAMAAGQTYEPGHFDPQVWQAIAALGEPGDGRPTFHGMMLGGGPFAPVTLPVGACPMGRGVRGGKSQGPGSGRLRLWECQCPRPVKVRVASDDFRATCDTCGQPFERR